jgi:RNA polymerase sigma-70 factor (ECF subfamily)
MHTTPVTLLERLRTSTDDESWRRLVRLYTPLLFAWARRAGASEQDAADLTQDVFAALLQSLPTFQYDKAGSFRGWLRTVALNKLRDQQRREALVSKVPLSDAGELAGEAVEFWERAYQRELAGRALRVMQADFAETTWKACWEFVALGRSAVEVARELRITENAVYLAKYHVLRRLRTELAGLLD